MSQAQGHHGNGCGARDLLPRANARGARSMNGPTQVEWARGIISFLGSFVLIGVWLVAIFVAINDPATHRYPPAGCSVASPAKHGVKIRVFAGFVALLPFITALAWAIWVLTTQGKA